jgi:hypothetical protein
MIVWIAGAVRELLVTVNFRMAGDSHLHRFLILYLVFPGHLSHLYSLIQMKKRWHGYQIHKIYAGVWKIRRQKRIILLLLKEMIVLLYIIQNQM